MSVEICDLRTRLDLLPEAARRIFDAWWADSGITYGDLEARLKDVALSSGPTFSLVAFDERGFAGMVSVIPSDMDERPQYGPWVAALWVENVSEARGLDLDWSQGRWQRPPIAARPNLYALSRASQASTCLGDGKFSRKASGSTSSPSSRPGER